MSGDKQNARKLYIGVAACLVLSFLSIGVAVLQSRTLLHLLKNGQRAAAVIVGIDVGTKGSKKAVFQFKTEVGEEITARDLFLMHFVRYKVGDEVTVLYELSDPKIAAIDRGRWLWLEPAALYSGFVILFSLGMVLPRMNRAGKDSTSHSTAPDSSVT